MTDPTASTMFIVAYVAGTFAMILLGILFWFRDAVFTAIKTKKMIKLGYIIARLKKYDHTEIEIVTIPDKETNSVRFPGIDGLYTLDNISTILKNRKIPVVEWREGETIPINHYTSSDKEKVITKIICPECNKEVTVKVDRLKSMSPSVLDNLILKIKTLAQAIAMNQLLMYLMIGFGICAAIAGANAYMTYDMIQHPARVFGPTIAAACKPVIANMTIIK